MLAHPDTLLETSAGLIRVHARVATGPEQDLMWAQFRQLHPEWAGYERQAAPRVIPVLVLEHEA